MLTHEIGETAGAIWRTLEEEGPLTITALKKQIEASDAVLYMAIGWLSREGKIAFDAQGRSFTVRLK
jgi:hypothetical protein